MACEVSETRKLAVPAVRWRFGGVEHDKLDRIDFVFAQTRSLRLSSSSFSSRSIETRRNTARWPHAVAVTLAILLALVSSVDAADLATAELLYRTGDLKGAQEIADAEVQRGVWNERWSRLLMRCQMDRGQYAQAVQTYEKAILRYSGSLVLRQLGIDAYQYTGNQEKARQAQAAFMDVLRRSSRYATGDNVIAAGRFYVRRGEDARLILEQFYDRVRDADPKYVESYIATAELAITKGDFKVAADTLRAAEKLAESDPRIYYLLSRSLQSSDRAAAAEALEMALSINPRHVDSLLLDAERSIDAEQFDAAEDRITEVLQINVHEPRAWALLAVLANLDGRYEVEKLMRAAALSTWPTNPEVDHLIGRKLSDKYRFAEGSEYQRAALAFDTGYGPAKFQLAQDLLRLGFDDVGWALAEQVNESDPYNVTAYNLISLYDSIKDFSTLSADNLHVRMDAREAAVYGGDVLELLTEAQAVLCKKYGVTLDQPVVVEIFPKQEDFAIRTFGLPGGAGFLGVCFGNVVTANSPASQGATPSNWQAVLWHEFCHVVTLNKTKNRMPRWLSEGISVYEERQRDPSWSEQITPTYKMMVRDGELVPISQLSAAFLAPKSPVHLQFAYYQSSLAVEYLMDQYGQEKVNAVLEDLGNGRSMNDALQANLGSLARLDQGFLTYATSVAEDFGKGVQWDPDGPPEGGDPDAIAEWMKQHPQDYRSLRLQADTLAEAGQREEAIEIYQQLLDAGVDHGDRGGVLAALASMYRKEGDVEKETETLRRQVSKNDDLWPAHVRLAELAAERDDWEEVHEQARRILAINPLMAVGHTWADRAAKELERPADRIAPLKALLELDPIDPVGLHYELAMCWEQLDNTVAAKRSVLKSLQDAPRFRDALALLVRVSRADDADAKDEASADSDVSGTGNTGADDTSASDETDKRVESETGGPGGGRRADQPAPVEGARP
ncbi:tetratricopeptide repeat protein [Crateriforma conspicua]|uniref:Tetratricopeptide repeat protein n=1 Tax=Crateriforma conspicua TaxID=2527996 RepID=A0A5C5Y0A2_9PLAN|nr:tetratricopeptide repeat protein [Crateriforma conspicua]